MLKFTFDPCNILKTSAESCTVLVNGPTVSKFGHKGITPSKDKRPCEVFSPTILFHAAGTRTEPPVSEPMLAESKFKDVDTAAPEEEPPGAGVHSREFGGVAVLGLIPNPENASSVICVLLSETMPDNEAF